MAEENIGSAVVDVSFRIKKSLDNMDKAFKTKTLKIGNQIESSLGNINLSSIFGSIGGTRGAAIGAAIGATFGSSMSKGITDSLNSGISAASGKIQSILKNLQNKALSKGLTAFNRMNGARTPVTTTRVGASGLRIKTTVYENQKLNSIYRIQAVLLGKIYGVIGKSMIASSGIFARISKSLTNLIKKTLTWASSLSKIKLALIAAIAASAVYVTKKWSDLNEEINKTQVLFRNATANIDIFLKSLRTSFGLNRMEVRKLTNDIQLMTATAFGGNMSKANKFSQLLASRAIDLGSIQNVPTEQVGNLIASALQGQTRAARSLGVFMSANETNARAMLDTGKKSVSQLTEEEKIAARINVFLEKSTFAAGDLMRTSNSIANAWRSLVGTLQNIVFGVGQFLDKIVPIGDVLLMIKNIIGLIVPLVKAILFVIFPIQMALVESGAAAYVLGTALDLINSGLLTIKWALDSVFSLINKITGGLKEWLKSSYTATFIADKLKATYQLELSYLQQLKKEQADLNKDNSAQISLIEQQLRGLIRQINFFGDMGDTPNPFEKVTEDAKELEKVTASIGDNITDIAKLAQEAAFKAFQPINMDLSFAGGGGSFRGGKGASDNWDNTGSSNGINWAEKQAWLLERILILAEAGSLFK